MNRTQFEHTIRAAAGVVGVDEVIVIGSQSIHPSVDPVPEAANRSVETDIVLFDDADGSKADLVDGAIGEASMFHQTFGYYAQGVTIGTALLPEGWRDRLVRYQSPNTNGVVAWCLSPEDVWTAKALAGRPKDLEFCRALLATDQVNRALLARLLDRTDAEPAKKDLAHSLIEESG
jgi:hypothetical protein